MTMAALPMRAAARRIPLHQTFALIWVNPIKTAWSIAERPSVPTAMTLVCSGSLVCEVRSRHVDKYL
jgi:hypothetical protein